VIGGRREHLAQAVDRFGQEGGEVEPAVLAGIGCHNSGAAGVGYDGYAAPAGEGLVGEGGGKGKEFGNGPGAEDAGLFEGGLIGGIRASQGAGV
jgi:hypothetical protein